jgi:nicotinamidase-related amidase
MAMKPTLILLDCQLENVENFPDDIAGPVIEKIHRLLIIARHSGWRVIHSQFKPSRNYQFDAHSSGAPILKLKPLAREPVFIRTGMSAYSDPDFARLISPETVGPSLLVGFSAPFSILATIFDAAANGHPLSVVPEAVGCPHLGPRSAATVGDVAFDLVEHLTSTVSWMDVVDDRLGQAIPSSINNMGI